MKVKLFHAVVFTLFAVPCLCQQTPNWDKWTFLIGDWKGEGSGQPGVGGGFFSFNMGLDQKVLIRKSNSEYPAIGGRPKISHEDLMVVYQANSLDPMKAIYFDNEGHVINYSISYTDRSIILSSEKLENTPVFRLTYTIMEKDTFHTNFEMSTDGIHFKSYIQGKSIKLK